MMVEEAIMPVDAQPFVAAKKFPHEIERRLPWLDTFPTWTRRRTAASGCEVTVLVTT